MRVSLTDEMSTEHDHRLLFICLSATGRLHGRHMTGTSRKTVMARQSRRFTCLAGLVVCAAVLSAQDRQRSGAAPGMTITGRVLDPDGRPVPNTFVTALDTSPVPGRTFSFVDARLRAMTNERGEYRLGGLYAGEFYLIALPHNPRADAKGTRKRTGFGNTFYPGVSTFAEAKSVRVRPGVSPTADITLLRAPIHTISGVVIGSNGQPVAGGRLGVAHGDGFFGLDTRALRIGADGTFHATGLQPGTYFLQFRESQWPPPRGVIPKVSQAKVTIIDADVAGVRVVPLQMVRGTGRLVVDAADLSAFDVGTVRVGAFPDPVDGNPGPQRVGRAKADLTFEFQTWPLPARIRVVIDSPGWVVKAVRHNGADITDQPIDFVQGKEVTGLEVVITSGPVRR
jgi:hypothetical protein